MTKPSKTNAVRAPRTPGAVPTVIADGLTLTRAREAAREFSRDRRDLRYQDVRIERVDGRLVEFAGPSR